MNKVTPVDTSSFTTDQLSKFNAAASLGSGVPTTITSDALKPSSSIQLPPTPQAPNYQGAMLGGQTVITGNATALTPPDSQNTDSLTGLFDKYLSAQPKMPSASDQYSNDYAASNIASAQNDFSQKQNAVKSAQANLQSIQAQIAGVSAQGQAAALQQEGRQAPSFIIQGAAAEQNRQAAVKALPLQAAALAAQAQVASAQGDAQLSQSILQQAQDHLDTTFKLHQEDANNQYQYKTNLLKSIYDFASKQEQSQIDAKQHANDQQFSVQQNQLNYAQSLSSTAIQNGQPQLAAKISALDPRSPSYAQDVAALAGQIQVAQKPTAVGGSVTGNAAASGAGLSSLSQAVVSNPSLFFSYTPTQKAQITAELQRGGYDISKLQNVKLSSGQQDDIGQMNTVSSLIDKVLGFNADGKLEGIGAFGGGTVKSFAAQLGLGSEEGKNVRSLIGNIKGTVAKLRGGTSFTPNEEKLLDSYTPNINDSPNVAISKLNQLKQFIAQKNSDLLSAANVNATTGQITKKSATGDYASYLKAIGH